MKIRKILSAVLAAALTVTMAATVSADETQTGTTTTAAATSYYQDAKELSGAKYYPSLMKLAEKYNAKEQNKTISFGKSMTKKFYTKVSKAMHAENLNLSIAMCDGDMLMATAVKGDDYMYVTGDDTALIAIFADKDTVTTIVGSEGAGAYMVTPNDGSIDTSTIDPTVFDEMLASYSDSQKGKYFKIKYKDKIYIYEEFDGDGVLFTEKGTPVVEISDGEAVSVQYSLNVKDSVFDFTIPEGYEEFKE